MVLAYDSMGRLLLVRHSYHQQDRWFLPGGGFARGEDPVGAGARELFEEAGCRLVDAAWVGTDLRRMRGGWLNRIELISGTCDGTPKADGREIAEATFFPLDALPPGTGESVRTALAIREQWQASKR